MIRRLSIRDKLVLALAGTALVAFVIASTALVIYERLTLETRARELMEPYAQLVSVGAEAAVAFREPARAREVLNTLRANPQILEAEIFLDNGTMLAGYSSRDEEPVSSDPLKTEGLYLNDNTVELVQRLQEGAHLRLVMNQEQLNRDAQQILWFFAAGVLVLVAVMSGLLAVLQRTIVRPITNLAGTTEQIRTQADYNQRAPADGSDEVARLGRSFNAMMTAIEERETDLNQLNTELEQRVEQRSADLLVARDAAEKANRAKSAFLATMSHELRTPLNAILGFSELMSRDSQVSEKQKEILGVINRSGRHLLGLINDVLDMSKIEAGHIRLETGPVDFEGLVSGVVEMMRNRAEEKGLQLFLDQSSDFPRFIKTDPAKLRQIIINLLGNAIKFTEAGSISIRLGAHNTGADHTALHIEVEDSGVGIDKKDLERIFEPFEQVDNTTVKKGSGLGLSLTKQFIELMGGCITVQSTPGKGSLFHAEIPVERASEAEISSFAPPQGRVLGLADDQPEWRILIAEDQTDNRLLLNTLLTNAGFSTRMATNGIEAIEIFTEWQPHLICMDRRMPILDGLDATRRIRKLPGGDMVRIIAVTASVFQEQKNEVMEAGSDDFIRKPYRPDEIFESIARLLDVKYVFEDSDVITGQVNMPRIDHEDLQNLPDEWRREFLKAARLGDMNAMLSLTDTLDKKHEKVKNKLLHHIREFQIEFLIKILEETKEKRN